MELHNTPKPGSCYREPTVTVASENLKAVTKFCFLGGVLSSNCSIDLELNIWSLLFEIMKTYNISLVTKVSVYQAAVLAVLLYGAETWTVYR